MAHELRIIRENLTARKFKIRDILIAYEIRVRHILVAREIRIQDTLIMSIVHQIRIFKF